MYISVRICVERGNIVVEENFKNDVRGWGGGLIKRYMWVFAENYIYP